MHALMKVCVIHSGFS